MDKYLIIWMDNDGYEEFYVIAAWDLKDALAKYYEYTGKANGIEKEMFAKMIKHLSNEEAISVFNALKPMYEVVTIYSGLKQEYAQPKGDE